MSIGRKIAAARRAVGLTQNELATMTRMSRSHIAAIEIDAYNPSLITLQRIAEVLRIPTSNLVEKNKKLNNENISNGETNETDRELNEEQLKLLVKFKKLDSEKQQRLLGYLDALLSKGL